ncbi:hypothetical protein NW768_005701 [Fusarium equiseti]|uniref:SH3 domain-containing protein n=1 Tax=Fusarium equiseti TaxID=61235 RepID=A0ABQ8RCM0_FUSEQ|nr:hypothetical protein NW768_005701 [Fusarium equiseti]
MHLRHVQVHRRADGLFGFGNIAHEIDVSSDAGKRHVEKRQPQAVKTVFKTIEATFEGEIGGYKTVGSEPEPTGSSKDDEDDDEDDEKEKKKEAEEKKKEKEAEEKKKEAEEAKEKAEEAKEKAKEEAEKKKAAEEKEKEEKEEEEKEKKEKEEAAKKKAAEEAKSRSEAEQTTTKESTTAKPTRTRTEVTTSSDPSSIPTAISDPVDSQSIESILAKASDTAASASATIGEVADMSGSSSLPSSTSVPEASGTSAGAKAGIAFGVLGGLLAIGLLVFFVFSKRRKQAEMERLGSDDEKLHGPMAGSGGAPMVAAAAVRRSMSPEPFEPDTASVRTDAKAPRVSLRPVTQFLPNWNGLENQKRSSKGAALALAVPASGSPPSANGPLSPRTPGGSAWERPSTAQSIDPANPFGQQAERVPSPVQEETASALRATPSPMSEKSAIGVVATAPVSPQSPSVDPLVATGAAVAAGAGAATVARKTSIRKDGPPQLDLTLPNAPMAAVPASPAGTDNSNNGAPESPSVGAAAIAAAGGPANSAVHRVQLDFKPTMDDELELKAGDLVRLLHEYDDGWALCIRLDRSRQGVVPRTCLSTRPVKPRPAQSGPRPGPPVKGGPPRGPGPMNPNGGRPQSPMGPPRGPPGHPQGSPRGQSPGPFQGPPQGRSMSPGPRSQSPGPRNGPPGGRPMSPGPRSQSPGPAGGRSQSPNGVNRRNNPPGPSPMNPSQGPTSSGSVNRKPVPGQAY